MKNKNLTFRKNFTTVWDLDSEIVIDISDDGYIITRPTEENRAYLSGPAIDRLHAFEKLNMEPKDIKRLIEASEDDNDTIITLKNNIECLKKELDKRIAKEQVNIHKLIDEVREKKDCYVHILIGDNYTSVDIRPDEPGVQRWIAITDERNKRIYVCPNCGYVDEKPGLYCRFCGEQLGVPKAEDLKPKKMTCREKLKGEHPDKIKSTMMGGCEGCPSNYGYLEDPDWCIDHNIPARDRCTKCWDREIES